MDTEKQAEFVRLYVQADEAANALHAQTTEVHGMAKGIEELTKDTFLQYAGMRARVVARATQEQAGDLRRALEEMGKEMRGVVEAHRGSPRSWLSSKSPYIGG